jgi:aryl-alcohol dehydrogenase-like predicted oxidoreductase
MEWLRDIVQAEHPNRIALVPALAEIARELGTSLPRLAIAWCLVNPRVSTVILGASRPAQLLENLGALEILPQLDTEILRRLDALCLPAAS